eukprot:CFRG1966T1
MTQGPIVKDASGQGIRWVQQKSNIPGEPSPTSTASEENVSVVQRKTRMGLTEPSTQRPALRQITNTVNTITTLPQYVESDTIVPERKLVSFNLETPAIDDVTTQDTQLVEIRLSDRRVLIDWMINAAEQTELRDAVLFRAIDHLDDIIRSKSNLLYKLQLVGAAALLIATKNDTTTHVELDSICRLLQNIYDQDEMATMDMGMQIVCPRLTPTKSVVDVIVQFMAPDRGGIPPRFYYRTLYYAELAVQASIHYTREKIAASALFLCRTAENEVWSDQMTMITGMETEDFSECTLLILRELVKENQNICQTMMRYRKSKRLQVALDPLPLCFYNQARRPNIGQRKGSQQAE